MVIKGDSRPPGKGAGHPANYLPALKKNESTRLIEIKGTVAQDIAGAFMEMEAIAGMSRCEEIYYHASINPKAGEHLTPEQWAIAVDTLETKLGLEGHQRVVYEHVKQGRAHQHIVWNRVNGDDFHAVRMSHNYRAHEEVSRELERQFGLERVQGAHAERDGQLRPDRQPEQWAIEAGKRTGINPHEMKAEVSRLWEQSDSGQAFAAALSERGYILAHGDKKDFVIVDPAGVVHGVARRTGAKAAEVRARLADLSPEEMPTVAQAKELQQEKKKEREAERERDRAGHMAATLYDRGDMVSMQRDAMRHMKDAAHTRANQQQQERREQEKAAKEITDRERTKADEKPRNQQEARQQDKKARSEQTDQQRALARQKIMRELLELRNPAANVKELDRYERERDR